MPKNTGKGGKSRKRGTNKNEATKRELIIADDGKSYALVMKMLGNGRILCQCIDGKQRLGIIRGGIRRRVWILVGDIILISIRDFQDGKVDVLGKYRPEEIEKLIKQGHIPESFQRDQSTQSGGYVTFAHDEEVPEDDDDDDDVPKAKKSLAAIYAASASDDEYDDVDLEEDYEIIDEEDEEAEAEAEEEPEVVEVEVKRDHGKWNKRGGQQAKGGKGGAPAGGRATAAAALAGDDDIDIDAI